MIERLSPPGSPTPLGPYSPAVRAGGFVFVAGQGPIDPVTNRLVTEEIGQETRLVLNNVRRIVEGAGARMSDVLRVGVFLAEGADFAAMNEVFREFFPGDLPARTTVICRFVQNIRVEIDCVARMPEPPSGS